MMFVPNVSFARFLIFNLTYILALVTLGKQH